MKTITCNYYRFVVALSLLCCSVIGSASAQELDTRARVILQSSRIKLCKSPSGNVALATMGCYTCPALGKEWTKCYNNSNDSFFSNDMLDNACWAGNDTLVVGGNRGIKVYARSGDGTLQNITPGENMTQSEILNKLSSISVDTSSTGNILNEMSNIFGGWVDAMYGNGRGKIWVAMIDPVLRYSDDCGKSWRDIPLYGEIEEFGDLEKRISDLYFLDDDVTGIFGTADNLLYVTHDNCKSFTRLATPRDQYKAGNDATGQAMVERVRIFGDYYVVTQYGKVFVSKRDNIDWKMIDKALTFDVTSDGYLALLIKGDKIKFLDKTMSIKGEYKIPDQYRLKDTFQSMGDKCYLVDQHSLYEIGADGNGRAIDMFSTVPIESPLVIKDVYPLPTQVLVNGREYYVDQYDVITQDPSTGQWYRYMPLGIKNTNNFIADDGTLCIYDSDRAKTLYSVDIKNKTVKPYQWPERLFAHKSIKQVEFFYVTMGCNHYYGKYAQFKRNGDKFVWKKDSTVGRKAKEVLNIPHDITIASSDLEKLVQAVEMSRMTPVAPSDTIITAQDLKELKDLLDAKVKIEAIDESQAKRYMEAAARIKSLDWRSLDKIIAENPSGDWSTTTRTFGMIFTFTDGSRMECSNADFSPNYTLIPWTVDYLNGKTYLIYMASSFEIGQLMDKISQGNFIPKPFNSKAQALYQLVRDY